MEHKLPTKTKISQIPEKGLGVIATSKIFKNEIIETVPIIIISDEEADFINSNNKHILKFYVLELTAINKFVLPLGSGLLYNHNDVPNAEINYTPNSRFVVFKAIKDIIIGEEITYDYQFENNTPEYLDLK